jgi:hypothetical protein
METGVDIFDFDTYKNEYEIFALFYSGLELYLRTAIFIDYKYNHLSEENRGIIRIVISKKTGRPLLVKRNEKGVKYGTVLKKKYFDNFTNVFEPEHLFTAWYIHFQPEKLEKENYVSDTLERYAGYEDVAFNKMYRLYVDSDWVYQSIWFTKKYRISSSGVKQTMKQFYKLHQ